MQLREKEITIADKQQLIEIISNEKMQLYDKNRSISSKYKAEIESLTQKTYEIIPKINSNDNIFITGSKTFLDKRNSFKNNS